jgi:hypothetical protein
VRPISALKSAAPVIGNPANHGRAVALTHDQFRFAFANAVTEAEAKELYATYAVPGSAVPLFQAATANLNPWTEAKVRTKNPDRGPLLIIDGEKDNTVPWAHRHLLQAPEAQPRRDGDRQDPRLRALPHHRPRLAGSRRQRPRLHPQVRPTLTPHHVNPPAQPRFPRGSSLIRRRTCAARPWSQATPHKREGGYCLLTRSMRLLLGCHRAAAVLDQ